MHTNQVVTGHPNTALMFPPQQDNNPLHHHPGQVDNIALNPAEPTQVRTSAMNVGGLEQIQSATSLRETFTIRYRYQTSRRPKNSKLLETFDYEGCI